MNIIISMGFEIFLKANNDDVFNDFHLLAKKDININMGLKISSKARSD